ncbi:MAG: SusC/RagA family TonB-linked outer membrane protein [Bacteroidales bacterium]|nr:SusC/RagA family TonB-linked outer membrane protein [Bacteroidales bacterium]
MKKLSTYIILPLLLVCTFAAAQETASQLDSIILGNPYHVRAATSASLDDAVFQKSPEVDIAKALYGQFSGLLVKQGSGRSEDNQSKLRLHGHSPLVLVDGYPRDLNDLTGVEIESVSILKDAVAAAIYGVKGANGVVMITTKRGTASPLHVTAKYQYGFATAFRNPEFSDSYTYAYYMNQARALDGLAPRYTNEELNGFYNNSDPYAYPNVDWWNQIFRDHGDKHRAEFTFSGGNMNFRYFTSVDYLKDNAMFVTPSSDDRYNGHVYDNRLGIRANVDVNITRTTAMKIGVMARLSESNKPYFMRSSNAMEKLLYRIPAAAFPIKHADGTYGGSSIFGNNNPVALFQESGQHQYSNTKVLANLDLRQDLGGLLPGLSADASVAFDYIGKLTEVAQKEFQYAELVGGSLKYYGTNSKTVDFSHWFSSLQMKAEIQGRLNWQRDFGKNHFETHVGYRQRSWVENERNASSKTQEIFATASWNWNERIFADAVLNYAGSAYLQPGKRFNLYPAVSVGAIVSNEPYVKVAASWGLSGSDEDLEHELWRQAYGSSNGHSYYFGAGDNPTSYSGRAEGDMAALTLAPERSNKATLGVETKLLRNRLSASVDGFLEQRSNILISPSNVSEVIGIGMNEQSLGEYRYAGFDAALAWDDKIGDFNYGLYANGGWLFSKVIDDGQAYQAYDYLYHKGNPVGQRYGLEVIGIFQNQLEINNSPRQTFGDVRPGDLKYRDQNGDGIIDSQDVVKMFGSSTPLLEFGFGLHLEYKGFKIFADFQGVTGVTVSLLDSPLYQPLTGNSTISDTFLSREIPWTPETADRATMPRLTTLEGDNNYRSNSLWYRDGSFIKLRNAGISYTISRKVLKLCDATISVNGTNLFSLDNIQFADPEQLGAVYPSTRVFWGSVKFNF